MDAGSVVVGGGGGAEGISCVCIMGGVLEECGNGKVKYKGGSKRHVLVKEVMKVEEVHRMVKEIVGSDKSEQKVWYRLKYNQQMLMPIDGDMDVSMIFKENK